MKRKFMALVCIMLCLSLGSCLVVFGVIDSNAANTTVPNYFLNFTNSEIEYDLGVTNQLNVEFADGYTKMTSMGTDPHIYLPVPSGNVKDNRYILIIFRTTSAGGGELYCAKDDGIPMGESDSTRLSWSSWEATGEWQTMILDISNMCQSGEKFTNFRFDPFAGNSVGSFIDIKCIAGFSSRSAAEGFDLDEYINYLATHPVWEQHQYREMKTRSGDAYEGTLKYTDNGDGTVTISYVYNGETKSYTVPNDPLYTSGGFAGTDDVGRSLYNSNTVGVYGENGEHYVGLFYFLWMGPHGDPGVYDLTKIQHLYGVNAANANYVDPATGQPIYAGIGQMHWMGEPLFGYYYSSDEWVMRKHVELLTNAGVDFLYIDATNGNTYSESAKKLMAILHEYNEMGYNAPKIVFYTNSSSGNTIINLYRDIYRKNLYPDTWLYVDGKPCVIGHIDDVQNSEVKSFFTYKAAQWPTEAAKTNGWPWMDFSWPQRVFLDSEGNRSAISVSVAQHCGSVAFSDSAYYFTPYNENNRGRSFKDGQSCFMYRRKFDADPTITKYGYNFQAQWDYAIKQDVPYVLVTGWNEWVAQRQDGQALRGDPNRVVFIDTASMEFSRDIEMMRGGYFDNYYMQLVMNIQRLKGTAPVIIQDARNPINITAGFDQWNNVPIEYADPTGDMANRNGLGFGRTYYKDSSGRNDIIASKVTNDTNNVYFYVKTEGNIKKYDGSSSWMQLYVNADQDSESGWYGYDYIVNYSAEQDLVTNVAKYNGQNNEYSFVEVGTVNYAVTGNEMMISVPLEMLGIDHYNGICLEFKWFDADSGVYVDEMEDFYTYGDAAPLGRLNYVYQNCLAEDVDKFTPDEPVEDPTEETTSSPTEETTDAGSTEPATDGDTTEGTEPTTDGDTEVNTDETGEPDTNGSTEDVTGSISEEPTEPPTAPPEQGSSGGKTTDEAPTPPRSCGSFVSGAWAVLVASCFAFVGFRRKRE